MKFETDTSAQDAELNAMLDDEETAQMNADAAAEPDQDIPHVAARRAEDDESDPLGFLSVYTDEQIADLSAKVRVASNIYQQIVNDYPALCTGVVQLLKDRFLGVVMRMAMLSEGKRETFMKDLMGEYSQSPQVQRLLIISRPIWQADPSL